MPSKDVGVNPKGVARIFYKEIVEGDVRKMKAESNDSHTGGGARDFRFGDYEKLEPIMEKLFPEGAVLKRKRDGQQVDVEIRRGRFYWNFDGKEESKEVEFEPPTTARPREGRITRVHEQPCFAPETIPNFDTGNKVLLLLVQRNDGTVWPYFIQESSLSVPGLWDKQVAQTILTCIEAKRPANRAVIGYRDFVTGDAYCNGK
jgi:hypothetical protein